METKAKSSVYDSTSQAIISFLERGIIPWDSTWSTTQVPANLLTKRPYRAINVLLLAPYEYSSNYFLTEAQLQRIGAYIYKGSKPHIIIDGIGFRSLRPYEVYNVAQCGNIPKGLIPQPLAVPETFTEIQAVIEAQQHCPHLKHDNDSAYYDEAEDTIHMPPLRYLDSKNEYYADFFKMLILATKHPSRLGWPKPEQCPFWADTPLFDTLTAEIGGWQMRSILGLEYKPPLRGFWYADTWIDLFTEYSEAPFWASLYAQEVVEYILGMPFDLNESLDFVEDERLPF